VTWDLFMGFSGGTLVPGRWIALFSLLVITQYFVGLVSSFLIVSHSVGILICTKITPAKDLISF
jgi:hypothetical protein